MILRLGTKPNYIEVRKNLFIFQFYISMFFFVFFFQKDKQELYSSVFVAFMVGFLYYSKTGGKLSHKIVVHQRGVNTVFSG